MSQRIGIALSGGGFQGISHIGAIRALEELHIFPDFIAGTSSGSLIAALYAMGYTPDEMEKLAKQSWNQLAPIKKSTVLKMGLHFLFHNQIPLEGLVDGKIVEEIVESFARPKQIQNMADLKIPTALCTVDTYTTDQCIFLSEKESPSRANVHYLSSDVPLATAVRASMAFPGIYNSCDYKEYNFIDGGTKENLPVEILKDMGMDLVLAISFDYKTYTPHKGLINLFLRVLDIFPSDRLRTSKQMADFVISIADDDTALLELHNFSQTVQKGYDAVMAHREDLLLLFGKDKA